MCPGDDSGATYGIEGYGTSSSEKTHLSIVPGGAKISEILERCEIFSAEGIVCIAPFDRQGRPVDGYTTQHPD